MTGASNETEWAADRKVGFAMGILLIGVVAALFFRNEPLSVRDAPSIGREELIDSRLRDRNVSVYSEDGDRDTDDEEPSWTLPELLSEFEQHGTGVVLPIGSPELTAETPSADADHTPAPVVTHETPLFQPPTARGGPSTAAAGEADVVDTVGRHPANARTADTKKRPPEKTDYDEYTVRYGDTLSGIADRLLGSPGRYQEIYDANRDRMDSPDRLKVGAAIRIPRR